MGITFSVYQDRIRKKMNRKHSKKFDDKIEELVLRNFLSISRPTEDDVMRQLKEEGIIPYAKRHGGVAFEVPFEGAKPRTKVPRRLAQICSPRKSILSREEKKLLAGKYKEEYLDNLRKVARREEEKRRRATERKIEQQIFLQKVRSEKLLRKMSAAENRKKEMLRKRILPPIKKEM